MLKQISRVLTSGPVYMAGGIAAVLLAALLIWSEITAPLNFRQPIPSPDGKYFAYFDLTRNRFPHLQDDYDLIISTAQGKAMARFSMPAGIISWSNASYLAVIDEAHNQAMLIPNNEGRFLLLSQLAFAPGTEPQWSADGTKLAYVPPGRANGIAIYDFQQTQKFPVLLPEGFRLNEPFLLFWSPGSSDLFFLNGQDQSVALNRVNIPTGQLQELAKGNSAWKVSSHGLPRLSPDGTKIYLPPPLHSVIEAKTGDTLYKLPPATKVLWSSWSADSHKVYFASLDASGRITSYDLADATDSVILTQAHPNGFLSVDGRSYIFRTSPRRWSGDFRPLLSQWLEPQWGWQQLDIASSSTHMLGRTDLSPWAETLDGSILTASDDLLRVHYGIYDPKTRGFSSFTFPTDWEDLFRQIKTELIVLVSVLLYAVLAFLVYWMRPGSPPTRALYALSLVLMVLFTSLSGVDAVVPLANAPSPSNVKFMDLVALGWFPMARRLWFIEGQLLLSVLAIALVPPALLHFALVFPERNRFLDRKAALKTLLYIAAFAPLLGVVQMLSGHAVSEAMQPILIGFYLIAGPVVVITALFALLYSYRHPPDRRARDQVRWVSVAFAGPPVGLVGLWLLTHLVNGLGRLLSYDWQNVSDSYFLKTGLALFCLFPPLAIGYALVAHKLFDIQLLIRRSVGYSLLTFVVVAVYVIVVVGLSWAIAGSFQSPPQPVVIVSTLITALIVAPARNRLQAFIDMTFDRSRFDSREALQKFSHSLPAILDRLTLETRLRESVGQAMKCKSFYFLPLDRQTKRLRLQVPKDVGSRAVAGTEFNPAEPLCRHLLDKGHSFEVEVSAYDSKLFPIFQSASDRLDELEAALVLGLVRRDELVGMMVLGAKASEEFYNAEDLQLLQGVAHQAAAAVENTELFEEVARGREMRKELEVASEIQAQLFPVTVPRSDGCEIVGRCLPASSVSGDFYDFLDLPGGRIAVAIGDVSGKGMAAALLMANLQGLLRTQAPTAENPADLLRRINRQLYGSSRGAKYCTFFYAVYNERDRRLEYVNAGHNPPLLLSGSETRFLASTGIPLGLFPEVSHEVHCEMLEPSARVVLYSDGITEARNAQGEEYGVDRLAGIIARAGDSNATGLMERIFADAHDFSGGKPIEDDQTIVLLQVSRNAMPTPGSGESAS
jgi:sigma-B regulation protein RsbU (phosphoserine phosphatase)